MLENNDYDIIDKDYTKIENTHYIPRILRNLTRDYITIAESF